MGDTADRTMTCERHGVSAPAFVCKHLAASLQGGATGLGFIVPDEQGGDPNAWCAACDDVLAEQGEWNDVSEAAASVTAICRNCFALARDLNATGVERS